MCRRLTTAAVPNNNSFVLRNHSAVEAEHIAKLRDLPQSAIKLQQDTGTQNHHQQQRSGRQLPAARAQTAGPPRRRAADHHPSETDRYPDRCPAGADRYPAGPAPPAAARLAAAAAEADAWADAARTLGGRMTLRPPRGVVEPTLLSLAALSFGDFVQQDPPQPFIQPKDSCVGPANRRRS